MGKGSVSNVQFVHHRMGRSGLTVRGLAGIPGDSHHLYFTNSGWYDDGRRLVIVAHSGQSSDLFSLELGTGKLLQLTDEGRPTDELMFASLNPVRAEAYFWRKGELIALDLDSLRERSLYRTPGGFSNNLTSVTADGAHLCTVLYEDLRHRFDVDLLNGYVGFEDYWAAHPLSMVMLIDTQTGAERTLLTRQTWIGHVNASPRVPHLLSFCHEGPWTKVDHRIWGLDSRTGQSWKIRPAPEGEAVGHEYWFADGVTVGFHGFTPQQTFHSGAIRFDNSDEVRCSLPMRMDHVHSTDLGFIVGDGNSGSRFLYHWNASEEGRHGAVRILRHGSSARTQARHVHPQVSPDAKSLLFVTDLEGPGRIYMLEVDAVREKCRPPQPGADRGPPKGNDAVLQDATGGKEAASQRRPPRQGLEGVCFVDLPANPNIGSSLLRSYQLHRMTRPGFARAGLRAEVISSLDRRNAVLILNKASLLVVTPDDIRAARARGNIVVADPLDGKVDPKVIAQCSVLVASSLQQLASFRLHCSATPSIYVAHHVDLRMPEIAPPTERLIIAYFGEVANAAHHERLAQLFSFFPTDTRNARDVTWMQYLPTANAHYAIRQSRSHDGFKPFTKGFIAAHCASPVLADIRDEEAFLHLGRAYPYFVDPTTLRSVAVALERMRVGFGGPEWQRARQIMQRIRQENSRERIAASFVSDLLAVGEIADSLRAG